MDWKAYSLAHVTKNKKMIKMNQEESEQDEVDGIKKIADFHK